MTPTETEFDQSYHLGVSNVKVDSHINPTHMEVRIKASKTDPFRQGFTVQLGATQRTLRVFLVLRGTDPGPLFKLENGKFLTRAMFVEKLRTALSVAGYPEKKYASHSFRIGEATTAAQCGMEDSLIKTLGRWESSAYLRYIRMPSTTLQAVSGRLVSKL